MYGVEHFDVLCAHPKYKCILIIQSAIKLFLQTCHLGAAPGQSVEEEGALEGIQERQQPQGLPARGSQLAPLQLVQQVSYKYGIYIPSRTYSPPHPLGATGQNLYVCYLTRIYNPDLDEDMMQ